MVPALQLAITLHHFEVNGVLAVDLSGAVPFHHIEPRDRCIAERRLGFALGTGKLLAQLRGVFRQANTPPTPAGRPALALASREWAKTIREIAATRWPGSA